LTTLATPAPATHNPDLAAGFAGPVKRVRKTVLYHVGLLLVAVAMLLLPALYISLIVAVGAGMVWYATSATVLFEGGGGGMQFRALAFVAPLIVGGVGLVFMVKPLFAPRQERPEPYSLSRNDEPVLFGFVEMLCSLMGAPAPRRIDVTCDVNASASFRRGYLSFLGNDLVLTIGLPLVSGMTLRQLTGVLAHEFGHFAQGAGMRTTYIVNRINGWLARVAYERDEWDETIAEWSSEAGLWGAVIGLLARLFVWLTSMILRLLAWLGHGISCFMMRQQEFDADRYAARVSGSGAYTPAFDRLLVLSMATQAAYAEIDARWKAGQLPDDLVFLIRESERAIPAEVIKKVREEERARKAGFFDTHPSTKNRLRAIEKQGEEGVFRLDAPATALFRDFSGVCRRASYLHYRAVLGERIFDATFVPTAGVVEQREKQDATRESFDRYYRGVLTALRPIEVRWRPGPPEDAQAAVETLKKSRAALAAASAAAAEAKKAFEAADSVVLDMRAAEGVRASGLRVIATRFHLNSPVPEAIAQRREEHAEKLRVAGASLDRAAHPVGTRLEAGLSILFIRGADGKIDGAEEKRRRVVALVRMNRALARGLSLADELRILLTTMVAVSKAPATDKERAKTAEAMKRLAKDVHGKLDELRSATGVPYPFEHASEVTLGVYLVPTLPAEQDIGACYTAADEALGRIYPLYYRTMAELGEIAEAAESALKMKPLSAAPPAAM
jgi:hypothetical protein